MSKPKTIWAQRWMDVLSAVAPALSSLRYVRPVVHGQRKTKTTQNNLSREWIDEWAGGGPVTGEPSTALRGSFQLTLVPRERKRRDSNRGLVITTASKLCGLTYVSMIHRR
jgi:hypothetical protein